MKYALLVAALLPLCVASPSIAQTRVQRVEEGNRITENIPPVPNDLNERLMRYQAARRADFDGWLASRHGAIITTRFGDSYQVHWVDHPGGARQQLTFYPDPVNAVAVNPSRDGFAFVKDTGGDEFFQIYYYDLNSRAIRRLTEGKSRNEGPVWSNRGDRVAFDTTRRNGNDTDVHVIGLDGAPSKPVVERKGTWDVLDWSPDDTRLLVRQYFSDEESQPYVVTIATGAMTPLYETGHKVAYNEMRFARDGKGIYYTSNETGEFAELRYRDLATGKARSLTADIPWDVGNFALSKDGKYLAFAVNQDGIDTMHLRELASGRELPLPAMKHGLLDSMAFSADGKRLGFTLTTATSPSDAYAVDLSKSELVRWTASEVGGLDADKFADATLMHYPTFDQVDGKPRMIPAFYYRPPGRGPFPVIIQIHGGPEDQSRPWFDAERAFWVSELGVAVIAPNVRGSTGYGKTYMGLDNGFKREDAVKDIGALLDWIATQPELDAKRVGVYGGSYGGFMTLASLTHYSDRLRAGIELTGQSNFVTFLEHTEGYRRDLRRAEYGDERDPAMRAFLERTAPANNAKNITVPLFIAAGANDPRVPRSESEQIAAAVRANGRDVWYLEFKDEGHGFQKKGNRNYYEAAIAMFWQNYLLPEAKP